MKFLWLQAGRLSGQVVVNLAIEHGQTDGIPISLMSCEPVGLWNLGVDRGRGLGKDPLRWSLCGLWALKFCKWGLASKRMRVQQRHELSDQYSFVAFWDQRSLWCYLEARLVYRRAVSG